MWYRQVAGLPANHVEYLFDHENNLTKAIFAVIFTSVMSGYVVDVPELFGCMSQGKTIDEALINIKDAIRGWLEAEGKRHPINITALTEIFIGEVTV